MSFFLQIGLPSLGKLSLSKWNAVGISKNSGHHDPHKHRGGVRISLKEAMLPGARASSINHGW